MPYFYDANLDEQNQNQNNNNGTSLNISGASPTVNSSGSSQQGQASGQKQGLNTGSGFTNLDNYLQNNNSQDFGNKVLGKVSDQIQGAQNTMSQASDQFKNQVQSANTLASSDQINQAIANPTSADKNQFQSWEKENYSGPKSLSENQDAWNKYWSGANQAQTNTQLLGSDSGRFTLFDQYFGRPTYNYGEKSLDNLLFQQSGLGDQTQNLQNQATLLNSQGNQQAQDLQAYASQRAGQVEQNRNQVLSAIGLDAKGNVLSGDQAGAIGKQYAQVQSQVDQANAQRQAQQASLQQSLGNASLSDDQLKQLGLSSGMNLFDINLNDPKYLSLGASLTKDQVMDPNQRSYIQALSQLAGINDTFASGTAQAVDNPYSFNSGLLQADAARRQGDFQKAMQATPVALTNPDGSQTTRSMGDIQADLDRIAQDRANGITSPFGDKFESYARPALDAMKTQLSNQFQANRQLNGPASGRSLRPGAGPQARPGF
jgi:hypothetical protein